jgi:hypothetical protein
MWIKGAESIDAVSVLGSEKIAGVNPCRAVESAFSCATTAATERWNLSVV